jgi:serine/threonine protein kinase
VKATDPLLSDESKLKAADAPAEAELARLLLERKMVTQDELRDCQQRRKGHNGDLSLLDALVQGEHITRRQARRLRDEANSNHQTTHQLPGYELMEKLGGGAMGVVYKARQLSMDRIVAVKLLRNRLSKDPVYIKRFVQEAKLAAKLAHNHIVQAIDVGECNGFYYFVMEYVEGPTVAELLAKKGRFSEKESLTIVLHVARALEHAASRKLIHRDIKPENIMITKEGGAKLADLGLARETTDKAAKVVESGLAIGTPYYISPEQARGRTDIDSRSDIYSLGATLYHMVTGQPPFSGVDPREVMLKHLTDPLIPPDHLNTSLSDGFGLVVEKMLAKDRADRYANPTDLLIDLECLYAGKPPKLAQEMLREDTLAALSGASDDEIVVTEPRSVTLRRTKSKRPPTLMILLCILLGLSMLLNLAQFFAHK